MPPLRNHPVLSGILTGLAIIAVFFLYSDDRLIKSILGETVWIVVISWNCAAFRRIGKRNFR